MGFILSQHALGQMESRSISKETVEAILSKPDAIISQDGKKVYQSLVTENGKQYLIRIFINDLIEPNVVITVYKTSKLRKYHEG